MLSFDRMRCGCLIDFRKVYCSRTLYRVKLVLHSNYSYNWPWKNNLRWEEVPMTCNLALKKLWKKNKNTFKFKIKKICFSTFQPKTLTNGAVTSLIIIFIIFFSILFHYLWFFMKCWSKFDKNMVALRFKDLHIVPWIHQKNMLPLLFLEFNFAKWDTEKMTDDYY